LPRFDKAIDDRACDSRWPVVSGPVDLIILEGWYVGSRSRAEADVREPINELERGEDKVGTWRRYANDQLRVHYAPIFDFRLIASLLGAFSMLHGFLSN
jgi:D-glycerate 3-kinase